MAARKPNARARDMVISMAVILVPLALITWLFTNDPDPQVEAVDVAPVLARAEAESPYPVLRSVNLPEDWTPVRVAWAADGNTWITEEPAIGNSWQLGYLAPNGIYVAVQQRDRAVETFVSRITQQGRRQSETTDVAGRTWEHWISSDDLTRSLVWRDGDMVAVVAGNAEFEQLDAFAGTLATN